MLCNHLCWRLQDSESTRAANEDTATTSEIVARSEKAVSWQYLQTLEVAEREIEVRSEAGVKERNLGEELGLVWENEAHDHNLGGEDRGR